MTTLEQAWLAGIFEGEGSVAIAGSFDGIRRGTPSFIIAMTDKDVIDKVYKIIGNGYIYKVKQNKPSGEPGKLVYRFVINSNPALNLMRNLLPLLGIRRQAQIKMILNNFPDGCHKRGPGKKIECKSCHKTVTEYDVTYYLVDDITESICHNCDR